MNTEPGIKPNMPVGLAQNQNTKRKVLINYLSISISPSPLFYSSSYHPFNCLHHFEEFLLQILTFPFLASFLIIL